MRARWETQVVGCAYDADQMADAGWQPFGVGGTDVYLRRLVVARCEDGHDCDFDDGPTCLFTYTIEATDYAGVGRESEPCGEPVLAVPVDPFDVAGLRRNTR